MKGKLTNPLAHILFSWYPLDTLYKLRDIADKEYNHVIFAWVDAAESYDSEEITRCNNLANEILSDYERLIKIIEIKSGCTNI